MCAQRNKILESDLLDGLIQVLVLEVLGVNAGSTYHGARCGFTSS